MFTLKIRLAVQCKKLNALRIELGNVRQKTNDAYPAMKQMQLIIGEIEETLYRCEKLAR